MALSQLVLSCLVISLWVDREECGGMCYGRHYDRSAILLCRQRYLADNLSLLSHQQMSE